MKSVADDDAANLEPTVGTICVADFADKKPFFARVKLLEKKQSLWQVR